MSRKKITPGHLIGKKRKGEKITMLTAYDYPMAKLMDEAEIDTILIGDSVGNTMLGYDSPIPVTMDDMVHHTKAVSRAVEHALVIGDMPFMSYQVSAEEAIRNAGRLIKEGGADAIKLEGAGAFIETVRQIVGAGIPVVGHLGLTPQTATMLGGYRVQGRTSESARKITNDAMSLEIAGACMIVLECIPDRVAEMISHTLTIPTIGIGAGPGCDGQVLVLNDILGLHSGFTPKFVKKYVDLGAAIKKIFAAYQKDVATGSFPSEQHSFSIADDEFHKLSRTMSSYRGNWPGRKD